MPRPNRSGDSEPAAPTEDNAAPTEPKAQRVHVIGGIPYPVVDSWFDEKQNCVIDKIEKKKLVVDRGVQQEVTVYRYTYCRDEAIQERERAKTRGGRRPLSEG